MKRAFLLFIFLFSLGIGSVRSYGQTLVQGYVTDSATKEPVPFCSFIVKGTQQGGITDENGRFSVLANLPATLVFSRTGYRTAQIEVKQPQQQLHVVLSPTVFLMKPVTITTDKVITWHPDDAWTYMDFAFYDNYILSLVAMQGKKGKHLVLTDTLGITVSQLRVKSNADSLFTDCLGNIHLFAGDSCYQVYYDYEKLSLPYSSSISSFAQTMLPCRCQLGPYYYFSYLSYQRQKLDFFWINWYEKGKYNHFLSVHDSLKIAGFNEDYDIRYFLERRRIYQEYTEPVDTIKKYMDFYRSNLPLSPAEQTWLSTVNAPLAKAGRFAWIANTVDSTLLTYSGPGLLQSKTFFFCLRKKGWQPDELYADEQTGLLYGRIVDGKGISTFVCVDPASGEESGHVTVENYPYLTQPEIRGGYAYFLWKDPYSEQPVKLRLVALR